MTRLDLASGGGVHDLQDVEVVRALPNLVELILPTGGAADQSRLESLRGLAHVKVLSLRGNTITSLGPLQGWDALEILDLCDTGILEEGEVLQGLGQLQVVHLRGAEMKRDQWPDALAKNKELLDFSSAYDTHTGVRGYW